MNCKIQKRLRWWIGSSVGLLMVTTAQAELSVALLGGLVNYTTQVRGDALFNFNGPGSQGYYQYPADVTSTDPAAGIMVRYLHPIRSRFQLGAETGYVYMHVNHTRLRADTLNANNKPISVEDFTTRSRGLLTLNVVLSMLLQPNLSFNLFAGPAWLNTRYVSNDFSDHFSVATTSRFQRTADLGVEANWRFNEISALGMRFDYIFNTALRTISTAGSSTAIDGLPMQKADVARSGAVLLTFTYRYLVPNT